MRTAKKASAAYSADNKMASMLILANIALHGGQQAGLVQWALAYMARVERDDVARIGPLFQQAATRRAA